MKIKVQLDLQTYEVELGDLSARPIRATLEGETFEVWPEGETQPIVAATPISAAPQQATPPAATTSAPPPTTPSVPASGAEAVRAPIPGVIISIAVQPGASVSRGQELCMLEAMKMNNAIRSPRNGTIANVPVGIGQAVKHGDVLITFEP